MTSLAITVPLGICGVSLAIGWVIQYVDGARVRQLRRNRLDLRRALGRR